jgi:DNA polymerase III delta prime subunit
MSFSDIGLNDSFLRRIKAHILSKRIASSYLFIGLSERGGLEIALAFAKAVNCNQGIDYCDSCQSCRMINAQTHPDVKVYSPGNHKFGIPLVRQVQQDSTESNYSATYRFNILSNCETMTTEAQNALLKMLEEGRKGCVNILLSQGQEGLLQTILSRSIVLKLPPKNLEKSSQKLQELGMSQEIAIIEAQAFDGDIRVPYWILANKEKAEFALQTLVTTSSSKIQNLATICDDEENLEQVLLLFEETLKCAKRIRQGLEVESSLLLHSAVKLAKMDEASFESVNLSLKEIEKLWKTQSRKSMLTQARMFQALV